MPNVAVLGAGSWGTALAKLVADKGIPTRLWSRSPKLAEEIQTTRVNGAYLPGFTLPDTLRATSDLEDALKGASLVLVVLVLIGVAIAVPAIALALFFG